MDVETKFRDRDAPVTREGIIFRVYGYDHPPNSCICDVEYAPESIYRSNLKKAIREGRKGRYYKFYFDEGLKFIKRNFPNYQVYHEPLGRKLIGLRLDQIAELRRPDAKLREVFNSGVEDILINSLRDVLSQIFEISSLKLSDFGVFGSILHDFYHPRFSDLDLIIYGRRKLRELTEVLKDLYRERGLRNEFEDLKNIKLKAYFKNYSLKEYIWHQGRKMIYGVYEPKGINRKIKVEFEPVRAYHEIRNEYYWTEEIKQIGWATAIIRVLDSSDSFFMPAIYQVEVERIDREFRDLDIRRVVSFVEEFRGQLFEDEIGLVKGRIEKVSFGREEFHQITLSYGDRYFDQVLKICRGS